MFFIHAGHHCTDLANIKNEEFSRNCKDSPNLDENSRVVIKQRHADLLAEGIETNARPRLQ